MKAQLNQFGFYTLKEKPGLEEISRYYRKKYFQQGRGSYSTTYTKEEIKYINNNLELKYQLIRRYGYQTNRLRFLDVGCGEGHALRFFKNIGWEVMGLDFSDYGIKTHNPDCMEFLATGDIQENLSLLERKNESFDIIWLDNVLEHVLDPLSLLKSCNKLSVMDGLLMIEVPNDFSRIQLKLLEEKLISDEFWVIAPDHISYFNKSGLINLCQEADWSYLTAISDFPIDFNLFNPEANYIKDRKKGKGAHIQRIKVSNLMNEISMEKSIEFYRVLADLGLGRQIIGLFKK